MRGRARRNPKEQIQEEEEAYFAGSTMANAGGGIEELSVGRGLVGRGEELAAGSARRSWGEGHWATERYRERREGVVSWACSALNVYTPVNKSWP